MKNWKQIVKTIIKYRKRDDTRQEAMNHFCEVFSPDSYPPVNCEWLSAVYIDGVAGGNEELLNWLEYYIYEAYGMKGKATVKVGDKEYNFKKDKDVIKFFNDNYNI
jgi:hypothetical protein